MGWFQVGRVPFRPRERDFYLYRFFFPPLLSFLILKASGSSRRDGTKRGDKLVQFLVTREAFVIILERVCFLSGCSFLSS